MSEGAIPMRDQNQGASDGNTLDSKPAHISGRTRLSCKLMCMSRSSLRNWGVVYEIGRDGS